jgi:hypothetical protein
VESPAVRPEKASQLRTGGGPWRRADGRLLFATGLGLVAAGVGADWVMPGASSFGPLQLLLLCAGLAVVPLCMPSRAWRRGYAGFLLVVCSGYLASFLFEVGLDASAGPPRNGMASLQGLVRPAAWGGYEMTPGWHGSYDDRWARSAVDTNRLGDRDDDPEQQPPAASRRLLLLGDSQAFGVGLPREEAIESRIEQLSGGEVAAYALGVPGYGPGDSLEHYRERGDVKATHAFFLFYGNDVRVENCRTAFSTAYAGLIVPRDRGDGRPLSPQQLEQALVAVHRLGHRGWLDRLKSAVLLERLRTRFGVLLDPERMLRSGRPGDYSEECSLAAAQQVEAMRALAAERGQYFAVVVVPTPGEAALQRYSQPVAVSIEEIRRRSVPILEIRDLLSPHDYLEGDEHLGPSGAIKVAAAILRSVGS